MMRSLFSGVSGLQNHQTRMDVVGNNIANINTTGFKKGRVNFQDMLYQQLAGAARPTDDVGGVNPKEVGLGMSVASIDTLHTQGSLQSTGVGTDLAIMGNGFFILKEGSNAYYTRAGDFSADEEGNLVNPSNGWFVQGWMAQDIDGTMVLDVSRDTEKIVIPTGGKDPARATTMVNFGCNLDKRMPYIPAEGANELNIAEGTWTTSIKIYDSFGTEHTLRAEMTRVLDTPNDWNVQLSVDPESDTDENPNATGVATGLGDGGTAAGGPLNFTVTFSNDGTLLSATDAAGNVIGGPDAAGELLMPVAFNVDGTEPAVRQEFSLNLGRIGSFTNSMTQFSEKSSTKAFTQDGYTMGYLENFKIDATGTITGVYTNGTNRTLGQIALATFANQGGLEKAGETAFVVSNNSGDANVGPSGIAGKGKIMAGTLEMSNVDMAAEFVDMIVTQRGFQANSRTIQTADQLLQELLQLKR
jgi:flagellar hook protein FlgE